MADGLGQTLAPFCEVALHNGLSGPAVGDPI